MNQTYNKQTARSVGSLKKMEKHLFRFLYFGENCKNSAMKIVIGCGSNGVVTAHFTCFLSLSSLLFFFSFYWNQRAHVYSSEGMHTMSANTGHCGNVQGCNSFSLSLWVHVLVLSSFCVCQSVSTRMCKRRRHIHLSVSNNLILSCLSQRST